MKSRYLWAFLLIAVVTCTVLFAIYKLNPRKPPQVSLGPDILCSYVSDSLGMRCVALLGSDSLLGPGAVVEYPMRSDLHALVPLPNAQLFSSTCVVPGEKMDALTSSLHNQQNTVALQSMKFHSDRGLRIGADLPIPKFPDIQVTAGPQASSISDVTLVPSESKAEILDENQFLDVLANFGIRDICIDRLLKSEYQVVSKALVAGKLQYEVTDKQSQSYSLSAAMKKGLLDVKAGGNTNANTDLVLGTASNTPVVIAVQFLKPDIFLQRPALQKPVVYSPSGQTTVSVAGAGGQNYLPPMTSSSPFGQQASVQSNGREASECKSDFELTRSLGTVTAQLQPTNDGQTLQVSLNGIIRGGHYATVAGCVLGNPVGITGHDTGVSAHYSASGSIRTTVRSDNANTLTVTFVDLPGETLLTVRGPNGDLLRPEGAEQAGSQPLQGNGSSQYPIHGAGVYLVEFASNIEKSISGAGSANLANHAQITVQVH
jgi:hypothetical protein